SNGAVMTKTRAAGLAVLVMGLLAGGVFGWRAIEPEAAKAADQAPPPQGVPVTTAVARVQNVPVYLRGLGTVQAPNVVEIKAQVAGTLIALPVKEGVEVH